MRGQSPQPGEGRARESRFGEVAARLDDEDAETAVDRQPSGSKLTSVFSDVRTDSSCGMSENPTATSATSATSAALGVCGFRVLRSRSEYSTADEIGLLSQSRPWFLSAVHDVQIARRWLSARPAFRRACVRSADHCCTGSVRLFLTSRCTAEAIRAACWVLTGCSGGAMNRWQSPTCSMASLSPGMSFMRPCSSR